MLLHRNISQLAEGVFAGQYTIQRPIGNGRMSSVYLAQDSTAGDTPVAIKVLNTDHADTIKRQLFKRETAALKKLNHPNIVRMRNSKWAESEGVYYIVLDYVPFSLDKYLRGELKTQLSGFEPYRVMREIAEALSYAHSEGFIHRDVKPSNILLDENGRPLLTDFGISKLLRQLTVGDTLAGFWSGGYASPEQQANQPTNAESDIFSLGAVFLHLLSGVEPPYEGPTASLVDEQVDGPPALRTLLKRMLATDPSERISNGTELMRLLEVARPLERVPSHFLILTRSAVDGLISSGMSLTSNADDVAEALRDDLGGDDLDEIHIRRDRRSPDDVVVIGSSLRLICTPSDGGNALVVKAVQMPHMPILDADRGPAMSYRAMWTPVLPGFESQEPSESLVLASEELTNLLAHLDTYEAIGSVTHERRSSRRDFIERWETALNRGRSRIEKRASPLSYFEVDEDPDFLRFTLTDLPPDNLGWLEDTPLAVRRAPDSRIRPIGNLIEIRGRTIEVARKLGGFRKDDTSVPKEGQLMLDVMEASTAISRQQYAVRDFLLDRMANPDLGRAITDPSGATSSSPATLDFYQDWLSDDKKDAVKRAVSSNELFLIQGPPGTGKTSVIAEIVLQLLKREPDTRILLTSQSNIAVDHALVTIAAAAEANGQKPPEMVRLGRVEKIGYGGESWTLQNRADSWRQDVLGRCTPLLQDLSREERRVRGEIKATEPIHEFDGEIEEWIAESSMIADQLEEYEREYEHLRRSQPGESNELVSIRSAMEATVKQTRMQLSDQLGALNQLLPSPIDTDGLSNRDILSGIVRAAASSRTDVGELNDPATSELKKLREVRQILTDWTRVVGLTPDFQELIGRSSNVVAATCLFSGNRGGERGKEGITFDWVIVDEAGRATVPEVLIPIVRAERAILVGDERQLPPMIDEMTSEDISVGGVDESDGAVRLDTSLFQSLVEQLEESGKDHITQLTAQYRMHPAIGNLISAVFYEGNLRNGEDQPRRRPTLDWLPSPVTWLSTSMNPTRRETRVGQSFANPAEAEVILDVLTKLQEKRSASGPRISVGVISGYSAQVDLLLTRIDPENSDRWRSMNIEIATVDSFQGRECDVVIYSTVRSNSNNTIGFLRDYRRINVALSRARDRLVIVGDNSMMEAATIGSENSNPFASVLEYMRAHGNECRIVPSDVVRLL